MLPSKNPKINVEEQSTDARVQLVENGLKWGNMQVEGEDIPGRNIVDRMKQLKVHGASVAVINKNEIEWAKAYYLPTTKPVTTETLFQAGSTSKPVAATIALTLASEGKINLDQPVNDQLHTWKLPKNAKNKGLSPTPRQLLSHTGGTTVHGFPGYKSDTGNIPTSTAILNGQAPANTPCIESEKPSGETCKYSGGGTQIVMQLMEDVSDGEKFPALAQRVFSPLGMQSSTFDLILPGSERAASVAEGHSYEGKPVKGGWNLYPESAAAGLWTTPSDMARFVMGIMDAVNGKNNSILPEDIAKEMLTRQPNSEYGLGPRVNPSIYEFQHSGGTEGYACYFVGFPETGQGAVIMTDSMNGDKLISEIVNTLASVYNWPDDYTFKSKLKHPAAIDTSIYKQYAGQFEIPGINAARTEGASIGIEIISENNKLFIQGRFPTPTSKVKKFELTSESSTSFFNREADIEVSFTSKNEFTFNKFHAKRSDITEEEFLHSNFASQSHTAKKILSQNKKFPSSTAHAAKKLGIGLHCIKPINESSIVEAEVKSVEEVIKSKELADTNVHANNSRNFQK